MKKMKRTKNFFKSTKSLHNVKYTIKNEQRKRKNSQSTNFKTKRKALRRFVRGRTTRN